MADRFEYRGKPAKKVYLSDVEHAGAIRTRESFVLKSETHDAGRFSAACHRCRKSWMTTAVEEVLTWKTRLVNKDGSVHLQPWTYDTRKIKLKQHACPYCTKRKINSVAYRWSKIKGTFNEKVKCDSRCTNAVGPDCSCSCGGANHGSAAVR